MGGGWGRDGVSTARFTLGTRLLAASVGLPLASHVPRYNHNQKTKTPAAACLLNWRKTSGGRMNEYNKLPAAYGLLDRVRGLAAGSEHENEGYKLSADRAATSVHTAVSLWPSR